jgi:hypothetical protein
MMKIFTVLLLGCLATAAQAPADLGARLAGRIAGFHQGAAENGATLRLVYFHPNDADPQPKYQERITRIMLDIRAFLATEMQRNGFGRTTLPLEMDGDQVKLHVVEGSGGLQDYNYDIRYGVRIRSELVRALKGTVDFDREFVLVFCGLVEKLGALEFRFRSPYYGFGGADQRNGLCFAADCEMLDTKLFTATDRKFVYHEHSGRFERTLAAFNSLYIGGIAHELGHGISLPHNQQKPWERQKLGTALMGSGNYTYRTEKVGKRGSFLTRASALRLAAHPLFSRSDRKRFTDVRSEIGELKFASSKNQLKISGTVTGSPDIHAVIAYTDPNGGSNYDAHTWISEVKDGRFMIDARYHRNGPHGLRLTFCHANGGTSTASIRYDVKDSVPDAEAMNGEWSLTRVREQFMDGRKAAAASSAKLALKGEIADPIKARLRHLVQLTDPAEPKPLSQIKADSVSLSEVEWDSAKVGWAEPARDQYFSGQEVRDGVCLLVGGEFHPQGLYAHATSRYVYDLKGQWKRFTAVAGLQKGVVEQGTGIFVVKGDGKELFRSKLLKLDQTARIDVPVAGVKQLELIVESGKRGNANCWTVWGSPIISR